MWTTFGRPWISTAHSCLSMTQIVDVVKLVHNALLLEHPALFVLKNTAGQLLGMVEWLGQMKKDWGDAYVKLVEVSLAEFRAKAEVAHSRKNWAGVEAAAAAQKALLEVFLFSDEQGVAGSLVSITLRSTQAHTNAHTHTHTLPKRIRNRG